MNDKPPAKMVTPPNRLKKKIGPSANMRELLQPEVIAKAQDVIDGKQDEFISWAKSDTETLHNQLDEITDDHINAENLSIIIECAEHLRDWGGTFGYELLSDVAKSMVNYCHEIHSPETHHKVVISKHIEGLKTILSEQIDGDGGMIGVELRDGLKKLTEKYR